MEEKRWERGQRRTLVFISAAGISLLGIILFFLLLKSIATEAFWVEIIINHLPAVIGLPMAAIAALFLVLVLETTLGRIEFEVPGFKFRGASGPIVLWVLCFLAIAVAIKLLY